MATGCETDEDGRCKSMVSKVQCSQKEWHEKRFEAVRHAGCFRQRAYVDDGKQEVKIDFNEQRTHAEAKTTVEVAVLSAIDEPMKKEIEKRSVCCDHPFFYVVTNRFGAICFMGECQQP